MAGLSDFSSTDRKRLKALGVCDAQIEELRYARLAVRMVVAKPAARNDVAMLLGDVAKLAEELCHKLAAIDQQVTSAHALSHLLIEQGYWQARPDDRGATSFHCLAPRLNALSQAARSGENGLPNVASRHRSADPRPVRAIADALQRGWAKEHGSNVFSVRYVGDQEVKTYLRGPRRKSYPRELKPSSAENSAFRAVVGVCYEAEGGTADPLAAIKNYLRAERDLRLKARAALEAGIASAAKPKRRNRTSKKT